MLLVINFDKFLDFDKTYLRNRFSVLDFNRNEVFPEKCNFMKNSNKIKNIEKFEFSKLNLPKNLSNRAFAQIKRRVKEYENKKKAYKFESDYIKYFLKEILPSDIDNSELKKYTLPLIASFIVTDGHTTLRKKKELDTWELGFSNKNTELIDAFNDLIFLSFNEIPSSVDHSPDLKRTRYVGSWHKSMIEEIREYCYKNNQKDIKNLLNSNKKILFECFRIAMSCDGFVTFHIAKEKYGFKGKQYYNRIRASIDLGCKPLSLREDWKKLTDKLELKFSIKKDRIKCTLHKSLEDFLNIGGFIPKTMIGDDSKYFRNLDKNQALETLIRIKNNKSNNIISNDKEQKILIKRVMGGLK